MNNSEIRDAGQEGTPVPSWAENTAMLICKHAMNGDDWKMHTGIAAAIIAVEAARHVPVSALAIDPERIPELERIRGEMMRRFSGKLSMEEIASCAWALAAPVPERTNEVNEELGAWRTLVPECNEPDRLSEHIQYLREEIARLTLLAAPVPEPEPTVAEKLESMPKCPKCGRPYWGGEMCAYCVVGNQPPARKDELGTCGKMYDGQEPHSKARCRFPADWKPVAPQASPELSSNWAQCKGCGHNLNLCTCVKASPEAPAKEEATDQEIVNEYAIWCAGFDDPKLPSMYAKMCWWHDKALMLNRARLGLSGRAE